MNLRIKSRGQTLVEFTLLLPLILILVGGLTDVGLAFFVATSMENAVREGARLRASGMSETDAEAEILNRIPALGMFTGTPTVDVTGPNAVGTSCTDAQQSVTATATGTYNYMFLNMVGISSTTMSRTATMRYELTDLLCDS